MVPLLSSHCDPGQVAKVSQLLQVARCKPPSRAAICVKVVVGVAVSPGPHHQTACDSAGLRLVLGGSTIWAGERNMRTTQCLAQVGTW